MKIENGRTAPIIRCDVCSKRIEDAGLALAMWKTKEGKLLEDGKVHFCHKACHEKLDEADPVVWSSSELTDYLRRLVHNTKVRIAEDVGAKLLDELV
ncbi:MAG TPA: hypothetical protein PLG22_09100 [Kiritimatiellia bacterium]|nr:hypothetical protein [Kiritimatiellia bacterium]